MDAIILSIGDELVLGQTVDTNSAWLSGQLAAIGCAVAAHLTVGDDQQAIETAIRDAADRCDVLVVNGGLGPTADDLTRQALAAAMGQPLEMNAQWLDRLEFFFRRRGRPMPPQNKIQAMIPRNATMIENTAGTAAGIAAELGLSAGRRCRVFVMPGVPKEMMIMFGRDVLPHLQAAGGGAVILSRTLHTFGLGESAVAQLLGELMNRTRNPSVGTTVSGGIVSLRINARFESAQRASAELEQTASACHAALGDLIYGQEQQTLAGVVGAMLAQRGQSISTAESCTAGLLAKMLTDTPGSSRYFQYGWVTYSDMAKSRMLGVDERLLAEHGAVSLEVVRAMAQAAASRSQSTYALAISGIAGPDGGTAEKPVGTVCIALAHPGRQESRIFSFPGDREMIRDRAAKMALAILRYQLLGKPSPF